MENELILFDKDWKDLETKTEKCETCGTILYRPDIEKCIFCGKKQCWNCKLHCMYNYHKEEVKK